MEVLGSWCYTPQDSLFEIQVRDNLRPAFAPLFPGGLKYHVHPSVLLIGHGGLGGSVRQLQKGWKRETSTEERVAVIEGKDSRGERSETKRKKK